MRPARPRRRQSQGSAPGTLARSMMIQPASPHLGQTGSVGIGTIIGQVRAFGSTRRRQKAFSRKGAKYAKGSKEDEIWRPILKASYFLNATSDSAPFLGFQSRV